ncbi:MAG: LysR family transcriptional regulator [Alphaproteobacteria bacterium]
MDRFAALRAFTAVVESHGFSHAARRLGLATSSLTRQVDALEEHLGTRLLNRSTRSVTLTDAGERYFEQASRILAELDEADRDVADDGGPLRGTLRINLPVVFGRLHVVPAVPRFVLANAGLELEVSLSDSYVNLVEERADVAIRIGNLESSSLIARKLADHRRVLCASPDYLAAHAPPRHPEDLAEHACLVQTFVGGDQAWNFRDDAGQRRRVAVSGPLRANNTEMLREAAIGGVGVVLLPTWLIGTDVQEGRLQPLLPGWEASPTAMDAGIYAVYLPNRRGSRPLASFIDALQAHFGTPPYWDRLPR